MSFMCTDRSGASASTFSIEMSYIRSQNRLMTGLFFKCGYGNGMIRFKSFFLKVAYRLILKILPLFHPFVCPTTVWQLRVIA
jgi:hypothetical protein